ncbi:hypothetical protein E2C01_069036 [Portunus trituberculatus]|uniref:Uncharacterized protein n=1 Tax=Portunus trituberculatus TaxID=210409 RepID=A0A5B7HXU8_PORTR|nr:hypothetical protein [Portunus trituberculatus]
MASVRGRAGRCGSGGGRVLVNIEGRVSLATRPSIVIRFYGRRVNISRFLLSCRPVRTVRSTLPSRSLIPTSSLPTPTSNLTNPRNISDINICLFIQVMMTVDDVSCYFSVWPSDWSV